MIKLLSTTILTFLFMVSFSQTNARKEYYLKLAAGQVSFGTGDFLGYSFSFDASKNLIKKPLFALDKLLVGGELIFENGVKNPVIQNTTLNQYFSKSFRQVSSTILWTKISYYPFRKIIRGFNIQVGPTFGYSNRSREQRISLSVDGSGQFTRLSTLSFENGFMYGYRISTGMEFGLSKKLLTGFRLDFSNNNEGEINILVGLKVGLKL